jgi:4-amino-4-deoxy-L-arabinose transferase-like glycosyltransferase
MIMAVFQALFGPHGPFYVVPVFAAVALACTYALGIVASGSAMVGSLAALLLLASPPFLAHAMVPMSDVPATAGWTLACVLAMREPLPRSLLSGLAAGTSLLIRPNLVLLAAAPVIGWFVASSGSRDRPRIAVNHTVMFALGTLPGLTAVAMINVAMYGSPFESGYGRVNDLFSLAAAPQNLRNYTSWLLETQTVLVGLAIIPLVAPRALRSSNGHSSARAVLVALPVLVLISYLFYAPFENWTYLRFLLPAYPAMFVLMAAGVRRLSVSMPAAARAPAALFLATCCVLLSYQFARDQFVFNWRDHEQRYVQAGKRAAELTPTQAVLFATQHSGSLRYYADRMTLRYDLLQKDRLDSAVRELRAMGRPSFLVIDDWEREEFQNRFRGEHHVLAVERRPLARVPGPPDVLIFDLASPPQ